MRQDVAAAARWLLERLSRGVVLRRRLAARWGGATLYVSPEHGGLKYWRWDLERIDPPLLALAEELVTPGATVWDLGANVGLFAVPAAHRAGPSGRVLAVEPDVECASLLVRTARGLAPTKYAPVQVLAAAVAPPGERLVELAIAERSRSANALAGYGSTEMGGRRESRLVPAYALDDLVALLPTPDLVKIDVEGAEAAVLAGAEQLLGAVRPVLIVEVALPNSPAVTAVLRRHGYRLLDGEVARGQRSEVAQAPWCCLALPA